MRVLLFALALPLFAQRPPVVLMNGFQGECSANATAADTFGQLGDLLAAQGRPVLFFDNCRVTGAQGRPSIEELGQAFGQFLADTGAEQVDVVAHSLGGLILRSYLAGKLPQGGFAPPVPHRVRKAVFLSTPHMGALAIAGFVLETERNPQARELLQGSAFLWELATWHQGTDDLREIEALALVADGALSSPVARAHDGAVPVTSSAFTFGPERVRVLPYCHQRDVPRFLCNSPAIAEVTSAEHLTWRIVRSYLEGTGEWRNLGGDPQTHPVLSRYAGGLFRFYNAFNEPVMPSRLELSAGGMSGNLLQNPETGFFADLLPAGNYAFRGPDGLRAGALSAGDYRPVLVKAGPQLFRVAPASGPLPTLSRAPGMAVSLFGTGLENARLTIGDVTPVVLYRGVAQINAIIPDGLAGFVKARVETEQGGAELNILLEAAVPALFTDAETGSALARHPADGLVTPAAPAAPGEMISIFATGLGSDSSLLKLLDGDDPIALERVIPLAGQPGVSRIDLVVPVSAKRDLSLAIQAGGRISNRGNLPVAAVTLP